MSILDLPQETLSLILLALPVKSIINCAKTCTAVKFVAYQDFIWKNLCETIHGVDTSAIKNYNGQWKNIFWEGKAPWINLKNKRYIRRTIEKSERMGECIEFDVANEDLVLNWTHHSSSSYSPSTTLAVGFMNSNNLQVQKMAPGPDLGNIHFKRAGNYLVAFGMDQFSCIYPSGITTNNFTVFKYDPNNLPKSMKDALFKVSAKSIEYAQEPRMLFNSEDRQLIYYASTLAAPAARTDNGPFVVEIFDLKTESETPIKKLKLLGDAYAFSGKYIALTKTGKHDQKVYLANWQSFPEKSKESFNYEGKDVKMLMHESAVESVLFYEDLVACPEKDGYVTIWTLKADVPKVLKRFDLKKLTTGTVTQFHGSLLWVVFNPNEPMKVRNSCMVIDWQKEEEIVTISPKELYFGARPLYAKNGMYSGKMVLSMAGRMDILYTSTPYLAKKFDVAILTSDNDKIIAKRATTIYGSLAEDCKTLLDLPSASSLTSQVILDNGARRYVLLFKEDIHEPSRNEDQDAQKITHTPLTKLMHMTVLSHNKYSPYGGIEYSGLDLEKKNPSMRRRIEISVNKLMINGACLLMKEEMTEEFGWTPVDLEHNLEMLLGDIERDMRTLYAAYHGFK
eukprot:TRINITY_DN5209_c0_g1_i1.p1 TRINITY_DN5209_c0_g1~~TRINITY_DN5209_c0_g1_i1.p1  ORF type:complete len:630 (+),score=53.01 TRINITY_DN5209_c0_g1_i1:26-1891(+)